MPAPTFAGTDPFAPLEDKFNLLGAYIDSALATSGVRSVADLNAVSAVTPVTEGNLLHIDEGDFFLAYNDGAWRQATQATFTSTAARDTAFNKASNAYKQQGYARALDTSTGIVWGYHALYNSGSNPGGAKAAGWYPVAGGNKYGGKMGRGAGALTMAGNGDTVIGGTNVWSETVSSASKSLGPTFTAATGTWTAGVEGVYRVVVAIRGTSSATVGLMQLKKNNTAASSAGTIAQVLDVGAGVLAGMLVADIELAAADTLTLSHYNASGAAAIGSAAEDIQFGLEYAHPARR